MKNIYLLVIVLLISATSCQKFSALEKDPNRPGQVPPSLVLTNVLYSSYYSPWSDVSRWNQFWCSNYAYYNDQTYDWTNANFNFAQLQNVKQMTEEATRVGLPANNPYSALGKFFYAYFFVDMSMKLGDVPMTDALKGLDNTQPKYDTQKAVFKQSLAWLEEANSDLQLLINSNDNSLV
ncbi:MAG: SusD/RagB family nutrient-binding outer membrane lipoprotein, partial [Mariniphaga sp.]